ncbi:MAG: O-antigen ligase family protein [Cyanobacteria bacterium J06632_3]
MKFPVPPPQQDSHSEEITSPSSALAQDILPQEKLQRREKLWLLGFVLLPYASYVGLVIFAILFFQALWHRGQAVVKLCSQLGFGWVALAMVISASNAAVNKGDALLQLTNFLPFFLFFGVVALEPAWKRQSFAKLEMFARAVLITAMPLFVLAIVQYLLKTDVIWDYRTQRQLFSPWLMDRIYGGALDRADAFFSNSNTLCAYLLMILGLGLGLLLKSMSLKSKPIVEIVAILLCGAAIFATGSRMGLVVMLVLGAIALYAARRHRKVLFSGLFCGAIVAAAALTLGLGDRTLSLSMFQDDVRGPLWRFAGQLIAQRPWLGWGLGGLRSQYVPYSIQEQPMLSHAHNFWLFLASEAGIPIMIGFTLVIGMICYRSVRTFLQQPVTSSQRAVFLGYLLAFASCVLYGIFDVVLFDSRLNVLSWSLLAAIYVLHRSATEEKGATAKKRR